MLDLDKTNAAYQAWLDQSIDTSVDGRPIRQRDIMSQTEMAMYAIPFCAGVQSVTPDKAYEIWMRDVKARGLKTRDGQPSLGAQPKAVND